MAVNEKNSPKIEQILLDLLANSLFGAGRKIECNPVIWPLVWHESYVQAVSLIAFSGESPQNCDERFLEKMRTKLQNDVRGVMHINREHIRLHKMLSDADIPYVILKGAASAAYYPDPLLRAMGDVDFLVDEKDIKRTCKVLEKNGLKRNPKEHEKHIVYFDENGTYELHVTPAGVPKGDDGQKVRELLRDIIDTSREIKTDFGVIRVPDHFHHGLVVLLHTCCHLTSEGIGLRQLCDWGAFVSGFTDEEFSEMFEEKLKSVGLWRFSRVLTQVCTECLGLPERRFAGDYDKAVVDSFTEDIFKSGNLGQKNPVSVQESLFVCADKSKKSVLRHLVSSVNKIVYFYWGFTQKYKILLPLGWLFFGGRYIIRSLTGKRPKINIKKLKEETNTRSSLYDEIKLFKE